MADNAKEDASAKEGAARAFQKGWAPNDGDPVKPSDSQPDPWKKTLLGETLLADATVRLFGRPFPQLELRLDAFPKDPRINERPDPKLARIYGFSWKGTYFKLPVPTVMLVYGDGIAIEPGFENAGISEVGIEFKDEFFTKWVRMWPSYETEFAVRIDITSGFLSEVLIAPEASDASNVTGTGDGSGILGRASVAGRASLAARAAHLVGRPPNS